MVDNVLDEESKLDYSESTGTNPLLFKANNGEGYTNLWDNCFANY